MCTFIFFWAFILTLTRLRPPENFRHDILVEILSITPFENMWKRNPQTSAPGSPTPDNLKISSSTILGKSYLLNFQTVLPRLQIFVKTKQPYSCRVFLEVEELEYEQLSLEGAIDKLDNCRALTLKMFLMLEKRLTRNPNLQAQYIEFHWKNEPLAHCYKVYKADERAFNMLHHTVLRSSNSSTKCRVVIEASGISLPS